MVLSFSNLISVKAQPPYVRGTTTNVTIRGYLDNIIVTDIPINFTVEPGLAPATDNNTKQREPEGIPYINVSLIDPTTPATTNVAWNASINATDMVDGLGHWIPVNEIKVNSTCNSTLMELGYSLQYVCKDIIPNGYILIYFYLDVPAGQYNNTYSGDVWIYAYSSAASPDANNRTWYGPENTTVTIKKVWGIEWSLKPIIFPTLNPGETSNATSNQGWPTNITVTADTNIFIDIYINGTDLNCTTCIPGPDTWFDSRNITYANTSLDDYFELPGVQSYWHPLNDLRPLSPEGGDFTNWDMIPNDTDVYSWWNISIPLVSGGDYYGNVTAKAVDAGTNPG